ncbi:odorant receptor 125-4 [Danio rerio]|uniref:Odorant receptor n=1 Tax=Danio rerio TaxID=7955 RepID=Q2PRA3_DANRE|nr:odorant receptor 125-4 [Danio rerio]ABC43364.1 odorant receptor [Danio rerio]|eukprot:NP_001122039.1 odorant receptor, family E, subfamily 125, member 4 [Danio rerio]
MDNQTVFASYTLMVPRDSKSFRHIYFICFLVLYVLIILVNAWVSTVIVLERTLHQPMYIFLCNLCVNDIYGAAGFYPKFLHDLMLDSYVIPSYMCAVQTFVIYSSLLCDCTTVTVMAYDRLVAICQPLNYHNKLNKFSCSVFLSFCWILPFGYVFICVVLSNRKKLCKYHIKKLYCDNWSIVKLSCESHDMNSILGLFVIAFYSCLCVFIFFSYVKLIIACKASLECRRKFWQTCVPHMFTVINYMFSAFFDAMYGRYGAGDISDSFQNFLALEMLIVPPLVNPIVYGLKLQEVRKQIFKSFVQIKK